MRRLFLAMAVVTLLVGCAQQKVYERAGANPAMFEKESAECKRWAGQKATMRSGSSIPLGRDIGLGTGSQASVGTFEAGDEDRYYRAYDECLRQKGWKQVPEPRK